MIRLAIADDHPVVREGIKRIVSEVPDLTVVAEATDGHEAVTTIRESAADVLLLDVSMPGPRFLQTLERVRSQRPDIAVLVLSVHSEEQYAIRALRAGAAGYLTKDHTPEKLSQAIRRVHAGGRYVSETLAQRLAQLLSSDSDVPAHERLSDREYQVFLLLAAGRGVKEIGAELCLSPKTVSTYRARILDKMGLQTNADLIRYALKRGLAD